MDRLKSGDWVVAVPGEKVQPVALRDQDGALRGGFNLSRDGGELVTLVSYDAEYATPEEALEGGTAYMSDQYGLSEREEVYARQEDREFTKGQYSKVKSGKWSTSAPGEEVQPVALRDQDGAFLGGFDVSRDGGEPSTHVDYDAKYATPEEALKGGSIYMVKELDSSAKEHEEWEKGLDERHESGRSLDDLIMMQEEQGIARHEKLLAERRLESERAAGRWNEGVKASQSTREVRGEVTDAGREMALADFSTMVNDMQPGPRQDAAAKLLEEMKERSNEQSNARGGSDRDFEIGD